MREKCGGLPRSEATRLKEIEINYSEFLRAYRISLMAFQNSHSEPFLVLEFD